jgi:hypothetical protein
MSYVNPPVQYSGPIYMNTVNTITEYQPPTSEMDQRPEVAFKLPKKPTQPVPKIPSPIMDRIPQDEIQTEDGLREEERQAAFLENSRNIRGALQMHETDLGNLSVSSPDISPLFFGALSLFGLFVVYRAIKNYS